MSVEDKLTSLQNAGIKLQKPKYSNSIEIFTEGDFNDSDLISKTSFRSVSEFIELNPILKKINNYKNDFGKDLWNWEQRKTYLSEDEIKLVDDLLGIPPYDEPPIPIYHITQIKAYFRCSDGNRYKIVF